MAETLNTVLLPLQSRTLILPSVALAEVIPYEKVEKTEGLPSWLLGHFVWRDIKVPLIALETLIDSQNICVVSSQSRIVVLNRTDPEKKHPFFSLIIQGIPRLTKLEQSDITFVPEYLDSEMVLAVTVKDTLAFIPELDKIQNQLFDYPKTC